MKHGIGHLTIIPVRAEPADSSEQITQLLFGEVYAILEERKKWLRVRLAFDKYEGWIDRKQSTEISQELATKISKSPKHLSFDTVQMVDLGGITKHHILLQGSTLPFYQTNKFTFLDQDVDFNGEVISGKHPKEELIDFAFSYLNAPYLWGGRTPMGIDCSGFSQMVYKFAGYKLPRDAKDQALLGEALSFIEEAEPGDLAFFDNNEGAIIHVGILLKDNHIIHASGKVRIDRIDQHGIYNSEAREHTHRLRVIKKIF